MYNSPKIFGQFFSFTFLFLTLSSISFLDIMLEEAIWPVAFSPPSGMESYNAPYQLKLVSQLLIYWLFFQLVSQLVNYFFSYLVILLF